MSCSIYPLFDFCYLGYNFPRTHLGGLSPHHHELLRALHQETRESVAKNRLDLVSLLHGDANSHTVDAGFDEALLMFVAANRHRVEQ